MHLFNERKEGKDLITFKLAISYMKKQKGKTVALLSCIVLAVMLIFSMIVIRDSGYDCQIKEAKDLHGDYHVMFEEVEKDKVQNLINEKDVSKANISKELCNIVDKKSGVKLDLNSFDKGFIDSIGYKLNGREPIKDGEVVIEKEAANQMGISDPLNKNIDLMLLNKYVDDNIINHIDSANKTFKIVGVIEKPDKYYDTSSYGSTFRAFVYKDYNLPIKVKDTYTGTIYLKSEKNVSQFITEMRKKIEITYNLHENAQVDLANHFKETSKFSRENIINLVILIIVSTIIIYNIFNIIYQDITSQIGLMRSIGMSNKKVKKMLIIMSFIYIILGSTMGIGFGMIFSYIGLRVVYGYSSMLTIQMSSIICSFVISIIAVSLSSFIVIKKSMKMSIIDAIRASEKYEKKSKNNKKKDKKSKNLLISIAKRNLWRNKSRTILTMIAITFVGTMFILNLGGNSFLKKNRAEGITGGSWSMSYGSVDKTVEGEPGSSDYLFYKLDNNLIQKVNDIEGVKYVEPHFYNPQCQILLSENKLSKAYKDELGRVNNSYKEEHKNEYPLLIRGYSDDMLKNRRGFIEEGENILNPTSGEYKKVILVNNTNSQVTHTFDAKVIDDVKIGDIIDIKIPVYRDGIEKYENFKVEVGAIMKESYAAGQDGNTQAQGAQVIFREDDYKELTNQKEYNKLFVTTEKGQLYSVEKKLKELTENHGSTEINGKGEELKIMGAQQSSEERLSVIYQFLIILILAVNIIFIMRSNIITRRKELSTLRTIGMSTKSIKKILIIESELYGIIASIIGSMIAIVNHNYNIAKLNKLLLEGGYTKTAEYDIPWTQIIILFAIFIIMGFISIYVSKDKIEGASIVEGISENS
ncbi:ABC transporter permease [Paraclostridium ghonii]|uniref:ABC transport system permease protein n=1 Tax=Paraclostridium ghonii TaxID=29358 RepID=A0ABU0MXI7_9FIRM|nr:FtsX-like permease family protein [Paeniclostridium ghonii]MDQ0555612.1 putative ABC transport system permease protein [Paeniclostridium ghonii]